MASDLHIELREAIHSGDFSSAAALIPQLRQKLELKLASAQSEGERRPIVQESLQFFEDSLHLARVMRAHLAAKLRGTGSLSVYQSQTSSRSGLSVTG